MNLRKVDVAVLAAAILLVAFVALLPAPRDQNPPVPSNLVHRNVTSLKKCLTCHTQGGVFPLTARHPKRPDCFRCHREPTDLNEGNKQVVFERTSGSSDLIVDSHP